MKKQIANEDDKKSLARPLKRLGQNFLVDPAYASRIVRFASVEAGDAVVEIGPGRGAITRLLAETGCTLFALEFDRDLCRFLGEKFADFKDVNILEADALEFDFGKLACRTNRPLKIVANLPYNVATPILFRLFEFREYIRKMVLMFQKEVGERIVALPGGKNYGALSIFPQLFSDIKLALKLPPGAFYPAPKVYSAVLVFDMLEKPRFEAGDANLLKQIVSSAFSQRRKKLSNSLKSLFINSDELKKVFEEISIDPSRRAETLSVREFCALSSSVFRYKKKNTQDY